VFVIHRVKSHTCNHATKWTTVPLEMQDSQQWSQRTYGENYTNAVT